MEIIQLRFLCTNMSRFMTSQQKLTSTLSMNLFFCLYLNLWDITVWRLFRFVDMYPIWLLVISIMLMFLNKLMPSLSSYADHHTNFCCRDRLLKYYFIFYWPGSASFFLHFWGGIFTCYRIVSWQMCSLSNSNVFLCLLTSIVFIENFLTVLLLLCWCYSFSSHPFLWISAS